MFNPNDIPDHPIIRNLQGTGYADGKDHDYVWTCPKCREQCDFFYIDGNKEIVGCENCISMFDAEAWFNEEEYESR